MHAKSVFHMVRTGFFVAVRLLPVSGNILLFRENVQQLFCIRSFFYEYRNSIQRCSNRYVLSSLILFSGPCVKPCCSIREINLALRYVILHHRCNIEIRSEQISVLHIPAFLIGRKIIENRPHYRSSVLMCFLHLCPDIIPQALTQKNVFF